jgi:uncharacterized protein
MDEPSPQRPSLPARILQFPLTRILLAIVLIGLTLNLVPLALIPLYDAWDFADRVPHFVRFAIPSILAVHFVYILFVRWVERRSPTELSRTRALPELGAGMLVGSAIIAIVIFGLWVAGFYEVTQVEPWTAAGLAFSVALQAGYVEEVLLRGVIFRISEEGLGTWAALAISSLLFGAAHHMNPNATVWSSAAIALEAGVLLGAAYLVTRRLWLPIGIHFAWNFTLGGIFGVTVSGVELGGILAGRIEGPEVWTGGDFGIEASVLTVILCLGIGGYMLFLAHQHNRFVPPAWRRGH